MIANDAPHFGRLITAMVTPFDAQLKVDFLAVDKVVEHLLQSGTTSIIVSGTTGESPTLEQEEKKLLLNRVIERIERIGTIGPTGAIGSSGIKSGIGGKAKVIMGTGSNSTAHSIKATKEAEAQGADGILLVAPYYNKPNQAGLIEHFSQVANSTKLPIIVYNIPGRTGVNIEPESMITLQRNCKNIIALKDSTGNVDQSADIAGRAQDPFRIYSGDDYLTLPFLSVGACGVVSVASHIIGNQIVDIMENFFAGNFDQARRLHYQFLPLFKGLFAAPNPACVKYALSQLKLCSANMRAPMVELSDVQKKVLDTVLEEAKSFSLAKVS